MQAKKKDITSQSQIEGMQKSENQVGKPQKVKSKKKKVIIIILIILLLLWFITKFILNVSFEIVGNEAEGYGFKVEKASVITIGEPYSYIIYDDHVKLLEYQGWDKEIWVPDEIAGKDVTVIGEDCFRGVFETIFKVTLHDKIEIIEKNAFLDSPKLWGVLGGTNVKVVGENAFGECKMLSILELGENLEVIGERAFFHCVNLKEMQPQKNLVSIGKGAFMFSGLESFEINESAVVGEDAFMETTWQPPAHTIPAEERQIYEIITYDSGNSIVGIANDIQYLPKDSMSMIDNASVYIPESVTFISTEAFNAEAKLRLYIPNTFMGFGIDTDSENAKPFESETIVFVTTKDSSAHQYAMENDITYELVENLETAWTEEISRIEVENGLMGPQGIEPETVQEEAKEAANEVQEETQAGTSDNQDTVKWIKGGSRNE